MKRGIAVFLCVITVLMLGACGGEKKVEADPLQGVFSVGYGRGDVTPAPGITMGGFAAAGEATRTATAVLNKLCITCIAITDPQGQTVLLYTYDAKSISKTSADTLCAAISKAVDIPKEQIFISATHSHSTPDVEGAWLVTSMGAAMEAAEEALADRAAATMAYVCTDLEQMSFVRHYNTNQGIVIGDNFWPQNSGTPVSHTTQADKELRVVRFDRGGNKKPVILANWLGHASMASTGSSEYGLMYRYYLSSDYVGFCREYVEVNSDCHFALFMGASGNINPASHIPGEDITKNADEYGTMLGGHIVTALSAMTPGKTGQVRYQSGTFQGNTDQIAINALGLGSLGIITAPFEMFDTTSMAVRKDSPFDVTFVLTQTNGSFGYMPTDMCLDYNDCYEVRNCRFPRGSAEAIVSDYLQLLQAVS